MCLWIKIAEYDALNLSGNTRVYRIRSAMIIEQECLERENKNLYCL